jgi:hypothetical protein
MPKAMAATDDVVFLLEFGDRRGGMRRARHGNGAEF